MMELNILEIPRLTRWERIQQNVKQAALRIGSCWCRVFAVCGAIAVGTFGAAAVIFVSKLEKVNTCKNETGAA